MKLKIEATDMVKMFDAEVKAGQHASKQAMARATTRMKNQWRRQIEGAGLGRRLARTIRGKTYPEGRDSFNAAGFVYANSPKIILAHMHGLTIRSKRGRFLSIPLPAAGMGHGGARLSPAEFERRTGLKLRFVYRNPGPSLLVAEGRLSKRGRAVASRSKTGRGRTTVPIFLLVPQVKLKKRLDLVKMIEAGEDVLWDDFVNFWK